MAEHQPLSGPVHPFPSPMHLQACPGASGSPHAPPQDSSLPQLPYLSNSASRSCVSFRKSSKASVSRWLAWFRRRRRIWRRASLGCICFVQCASQFPKEFPGALRCQVDAANIPLLPNVDSDDALAGKIHYLNVVFRAIRATVSYFHAPSSSAILMAASYIIMTQLCPKRSLTLAGEIQGEIKRDLAALHR